MRIVGGALKNKRLKTQIGFRVRPTSEKVREALFSIIGNSIEEKRFLDLFAGSGAVGIEAASRGAMHVTFVELKNTVVKILRSNLESCKLSEMATIIHFDSLDTIRTLNNRQRLFDYIFIDPPYDSDLLSRSLNLLAKYPIMEENSLIITQSFFKTPIPKVLGIKQYRQEKYGETLLTFFQWEGA